MLGKLLKYEFRATGRIFLPAYAVLLVMSLVARLFYSGGLRRAAEGGMTDTWITVVVTMIMVMLFTAVWVVTLVVIIQRFWKNLLGREGYLTNVLPVAPWEHVCSKAVVSMVWVILSMLVSAAALLIMLGNTMEVFFNIRWAYLADYWNSGWAYLRAEGAEAQGVLVIVLGMLNGLFGILCFVLMAYAAMCIGQLANRRRVWASLGAYFGISIAHSILSSWLFTDRRWGQMFWSLGVLGGAGGPMEYRFRGGDFNARDFLSAVNTEMLLYLVFTLAVCAVLFWLGQRLLKKRLNLQ